MENIVFLLLTVMRKSISHKSYQVGKLIRTVRRNGVTGYFDSKSLIQFGIQNLSFPITIASLIVIEFNKF